MVSLIDSFQKLSAARRRWKREGRNEDRCSLVIDWWTMYLGLTTLKTVYCDLARVQTYLVVQKRDLKKLFEATDFYTVVERQRVFRTVDEAVNVAKRMQSLENKDKLIVLASINTTQTLLEELEQTTSEEENVDEARVSDDKQPSS